MLLFPPENLITLSMTQKNKNKFHVAVKIEAIIITPFHNTMNASISNDKPSQLALINYY